MNKVKVCPKPLLITLLVAASLPLLAQPADLGVEGVVKMVQAGLSDDLIIARLKQDGKPYKLNPEDLVTLKNEHVSDNVLRTMLDPQALVIPAVQTPLTEHPTGATTTFGALAGDPNDPLSPHDSGIYLYTVDVNGKPHMTLLERADYQGNKTGGIFASAMTYGIAKAKTKAVIPGRFSNVRVDQNPTFYFYFDDKAAGLGKGFGPNRLSSPKQFVLLRLEDAGKNRETQIMSMSMWGASSGTDSGKIVQFQSQEIRPSLYKVTPATLKQGEYCFMSSASGGPTSGFAAGAAGAVDLFDFGYAPPDNKHKDISTSITK